MLAVAIVARGVALRAVFYKTLGCQKSDSERHSNLKHSQKLYGKSQLALSILQSTTFLVETKTVKIYT